MKRRLVRIAGEALLFVVLTVAAYGFGLLVEVVLG